jgi:Cys-tRNA(Pro)/Cys-tRNA(Cys) deacylase
MVKNNVTRMLVSKGIPFQAFELPTEKLSGLEAAQILGVDPESVFKTIVSTRAQRGKPILALVPAPGEVDLKILARVLGEKKVFLASQKEAERITGLQVGGISPLALLSRGFQVVQYSPGSTRSDRFDKCESWDDQPVSLDSRPFSGSYACPVKSLWGSSVGSRIDGILSDSDIDPIIHSLLIIWRKK